DAELYYNDFNAWRPEKVAGIVRMVEMLRAHGIRIDGVGIQGHWGLNYPSLTEIEAAIDAYHAAGVKVMVTELDVDVLPLTKEGQIIGQCMLHPQFQLPEFKRFLDPYREGMPAVRRAPPAYQPLRRAVRAVPQQARQAGAGGGVGHRRRHVLEERLPDPRPHQLPAAVRPPAPAQAGVGGGAAGAAGQVGAALSLPRRPARAGSAADAPSPRP